MLSKVKGLLFLSVPVPEKAEFKQYINRINVSRGIITALAFLFVECVMLTVSFLIKGNRVFTIPNLYYAGMYAGLILCMAVFLAAFLKFKRNIPAYEKQISIVGTLFAFVILGWCAMISLLDLKSAGQIIVYSVAIVCISVAPYFRPVELFCIYMSVQIPFLFLIPSFQKSSGSSNYINSTTFIIIALAISYMRYKKQIQEFMNEKIIQQKGEELARINKELEHANQQLEKLSQTDGLTGVYNRSMFDKTMESAWNTCKRQSKPLSLIMIDIDFFKAFNDHYGHQAGDICIRQIAGVLSSCARRSTDAVARYGGEEFAVILSYTDKEQASVLAEKIRKKVESLAVCHAYSSVSDYVTISLGVNTTIPSDECSVEEFIKSADDALYHAKIDRNEFAVAQ